MRRARSLRSYPAKRAIGDGFKLSPLLTPSKDGKGSMTLQRANLKRAQKVSPTVIMRDY